MLKPYNLYKCIRYHIILSVLWINFIAMWCVNKYMVEKLSFPYCSFFFFFLDFYETFKIIYLLLSGIFNILEFIYLKMEYIEYNFIFEKIYSEKHWYFEFVEIVNNILSVKQCICLLTMFTFYIWVILFLK